MGSGGLGGTSWGASGIVPSTVTPIALNAVRAELSGPITPLDASLTIDWTLTAVTFGATERLVQSVVPDGLLACFVYFDGDLDGDALYELALPCGGTEFRALLAPHEALPAPAERDVVRDIANPFTSNDDGELLGTFTVDPTGDLANDQGRESLKKRVLRRATSVQGSFFHLPGYGFGEPLKSAIKPDLLRRVQSQARAQILREPDVRDVFVRASIVTATSPWLVRLDIRVLDRYGDPLDVTADVQLSP